MNGRMSADELKNFLAGQSGLWAHWGFEPWADGRLNGVARRQHFVKDGFIGRIAEYAAWDYIVWEPGAADDRERLWREARPRPQVMTQRFLFLTPEVWPKRRIKSFRLGFGGYLEFYAYWPGGEGEAKGPGEPADLTGLVDLALRPSDKK